MIEIDRERVNALYAVELERFIADRPRVITSYSIHYTKLYEEGSL